MRDHSLARKGIVGMLVVSMAGAGCTKSVTHQLTRYEAGLAPTTRPAPESTVYKVKIRDRDGKKYRGIDGTESLVMKGDPLGFRTDESGVVYAVAGHQTFPLKMTTIDRPIVWSAQYEKETQFGREMGKAAETTGKIVATGAVVGLVGWALWESAHNDDDCDYRDHHRREHDYR